MFEYLAQGFQVIASLDCLLLLCAGVIAGTIFGCIPGLSTNMCMVVFMPIAFTLEVPQALSLLMGIYNGGTAGGLISAILINIPGTAASIATTFDGHPMAKRGEAGKALGIAILYSCIGCFLGFLALISIAPALASFGLKFGYPEFFALGVCALLVIASVVTDNVLKGLGAVFLGMALSMIGTAPIDHVSRLTFGVQELAGGIDMITLITAFFAMGALFQAAEEGPNAKADIHSQYTLKGFGVSIKEFIGQTFNMLRSAAIGIVIGILPGMGGNISNLVAYSVAKGQSKHPEKFGTGCIDGIVASETSNNATVGGALIPMLTLGIPGDGASALLLSTFMVLGFTPGPTFFLQQMSTVSAIYLLMLFSSIAMLLIIRGALPFFIKMLSTPKCLLLPSIVLLSAVGVLGSSRLIFNIWVCAFVGLLSFAMQKLSIPIGPTTVAFILTPMIETNLRRGLIVMPNRTFFEFFKSPIVTVLLTVGVLVMVWKMFQLIHKTVYNRQGSTP